MLYIVSTPIGNLRDLSERAIATLQSCDLILCEDTRVTKVLLDHFEIKRELKSYHQWNERDLIPAIIRRLESGESIALVSDAGTPLISDPGMLLVQAVSNAQLPIDSIPGPCSPIVALTLSGFSTDRFQFIGFLPKKQQELKELLEELLSYPGTSIAFESPHRINETLQQIALLAPDHQIIVARELTKKFQTILRGTASSIIAQAATIRGECIILFAPATAREPDLEKALSLVQQLVNSGMPMRQAVEEIATFGAVPKNKLYAATLKHLS